MSNIFSDIYLSLSPISVIHSLPGRVRIKIPGLAKAEGFVSGLSEADKKHFFCVKGVETIEFNFKTSNVLIHYDGQRTNEKQIVHLLNLLRDILISAFKSRGKKSDSQITSDILQQLERLGLNTKL